MNQYIALLRGVNISGQKIIKMVELKEAMEDVGFQDVQTYIQSGNIVFAHDPVPTETVEKMVKQKINEVWGYEVPVVVVTREEMATVISNDPHADDPERDAKRTYFTFLTEVPSVVESNKLQELDYAPEKIAMIGKVVYFNSPISYGKARMNNNFIEKFLKVSATTRNWNTVNKLFEMAGGEITRNSGH